LLPVQQGASKRSLHPPIQTSIIAQGEIHMQRRSATSNRSGSSSHDAVSMLMEDHKKVQKLFRDFQKAHEDEDEETCQEIAAQVCDELEVHTTLEEELFYPAARESLGDDQDLIDEAEVEHQSAKDLIAELRIMDASEQKFAATFTVLAEYVKHHIKEEENEMFPRVKKAKLDVDGLGRQMAERKSELTQEMDMGAETGDRPGPARTRPRVVG
jgi:hemerythrin superfamily protein